MVPIMQLEAMKRHQSRAETASALALSILLHLMLILAIGFFLLGMFRFAVPVPVEESPEQLKLTIIPPAPAATPRSAFVETPDPSAPKRKPKKDTAFESNNNSIAASDAPPDGLDSLPSVRAPEKPSLALRNQNHNAGEIAKPIAPANPASPSPTLDNESVKTTRKENLALLEAPLLTPSPLEKPVEKPLQTISSSANYQPETRVTRLKGNVSNRGRTAIDAEATPLGRFKKQVSDAIGSRWYYYVNSQLDLLNIGRVEIRFTVTPEGKIKSPEILSNTSNESFASVSLAAIMAAEIPSIPPEVSKILENGRLEIDYSFSILGH